jgi:ferric-chelate reductase [NAD(P)H]
MIDLDSLYKIQYGMYIISTAFESVKNAQIATVVAQITAEPVQIVTCLSKNTYTHELIKKSNVFGVSVLAEETPSTFVGTFGYRCGRDFDKFCNVNFVNGEIGCPLVTDHSLMVMEAEVKQSIDVGSHTLFVATVKSAQKLRDGVAMTYEYYHAVRKGKSPKNAPTYQVK